jgi:hypothetical protein
MCYVCVLSGAPTASGVVVRSVIGCWRVASTGVRRRVTPEPARRALRVVCDAVRVAGCKPIGPAQMRRFTAKVIRLVLINVSYHSLSSCGL